MRLAKKVAIITGAGRGIGREMALRFAVEGARVVVADVDGQRAGAVSAEIRASGGTARAVPVDITVPAQVDSLIQATLAHFGRLDVLVNNAGVGLNKPFLTTTPEEWDRLIRVNLTGTFLCAQAAARVMVEQGGGRIVNIASISGQRGGQGRAAYGASKAGIILLTRVMAVELAVHGITVNAIAPGPVVTDMSNGTHTEATRRSYHERIPLRRYGTPAEIAAAAVFLASDEASFVNGHTLNVDGGFDAAGLLFDPDERAGQTPRVLPNGETCSEGSRR
ncbi:MAG TPA: 3-oxoacyl-ACP reductase family protein [Gemmataceae bacterium]|nr:3-oxoacyl-ACP reductase family protein [Gemmataceae bacterium]